MLARATAGNFDTAVGYDVRRSLAPDASSSDLAALDGLADATANEVNIAAVRMAYEKDERIRVPASFIGRIGQS
jgi:hypothetical protein